MSKEMYSPKETVAARLKQCRTAKKWSHVKVAMLLGMTQQQYSLYENAHFELDYNRIIFICNLYGITADYLLGLSGK